ncbi:MAG: hypothetical protein MRERC_2c156 [Mycoplasmataceae bacterium RC_NB112A]|nr:MAG: hypothetical protein MRERC_2c156 [Mycoplasmataceae bacterium RC_NB112A]
MVYFINGSSSVSLDLNSVSLDFSSSFFYLIKVCKLIKQ